MNRHTIKPGLAPLAWPGLKVDLASILASKLVLKKKFGLASKVGLASNLASKECQASIFKICFFFELKIYVIYLFIQLSIHLDKYSTNITYQHMHQSI